MDAREEIKINEDIKSWMRYCEEDEALYFELSELVRQVEGEEPALAAEAEKQLRERFCRQLSFGTGGLRGILGVGTNRMNRFTVAKATKGLSDYLHHEHRKETLRVAIGYDSRINSRLFADTAARILAGEGCQVYLYDELAPTPMLSYAVRRLGCQAGIMVTASHNPAQYNGYKVYNHHGCQLNLEEADQVIQYVERVSIQQAAQLLRETAGEKTQILPVPDETVESYFREVRDLGTGEQCGGLAVVYTPLNGAGNKPVRRALEEAGIGQIYVVSEQELPDGSFTTCPYPNPEKREALELGMRLCKTLFDGQALGKGEGESVKPDLLLATDPDCDRVGVGVCTYAPDGDGSMQRITLLNGNQTGILLLDYMCQSKLAENRPQKEKHRPIVIKTIVSTEMGDAVAAHYGMELRNVLTGFKFIGEQINLLEAEGQESRYLFGFEESYGYLAGTAVRDKDAVSASMLICEMAAYYKKQGLTLLDRMAQMYEQFGYYMDELLDYTFEGVDGMQKMKDIMEQLRVEPEKMEACLKSRIEQMIDYQNQDTGLPKSDVLLFRSADGIKAVVRPSGTEPKLKVYLSVKADSEEKGRKKIKEIAESLTSLIE